MRSGPGPLSLRLLASLALSGASVAGCSCGAAVLDSRGVHHDAGPSGKGGTGGGEQDGARRADGSGTDAMAYSPETGVQSHSGSQVSVMGYRAEDAETTAADPVLRDKKHDVKCSIRIAADGTARCLPDSNVVAFTDPDCTKPIAIEGLTVSCERATSPTYGIDFWAGDALCRRSRSSAYELGEPIDSPPVVYTLGNYGCVQSSTLPDGVSFRTATKTPLDDWVKFERETTKVTDRLGVSSWIGTDGTRWAQSLVLLPEGTLCEGATQGGGTARCIPSDRLLRRLSGPYFGDSACTEPIAARCEPNPALIEDAPSGDAVPPDCADRHFLEAGQLHRLGKEVDHAAIYTSTAGCSVAPADHILGAFLYYTAGDPVPLDGYPIVGETLSGTGRFQRRFYVAENGSKLFAVPGLFYDTEAMADCHAQDIFADGRTVCVPDHALASSDGNGFGDPACSVKIAVSDGCRAPIGALVSEFQASAGTSCLASLNRVTQHAGPQYREANNACTVLSSPASPLTIFDVGARAEPDVLFPLLESIDL